MCDYSLELYRSRPAREGERYTTHRFPSGSIGVVSPGDCGTAVCIPRDTGLRLEGLPQTLQGALGLGPVEDVTFVEVECGRYRDGIAFANGRSVSLQHLGPGVTVTLTRAVAAPERGELRGFETTAAR